MLHFVRGDCYCTKTTFDENRTLILIFFTQLNIELIIELSHAASPAHRIDSLTVTALCWSARGITRCNKIKKLVTVFAQMYKWGIHTCPMMSFINNDMINVTNKFFVICALSWLSVLQLYFWFSVIWQIKIKRKEIIKKGMGIGIQEVTS